MQRRILATDRIGKYATPRFLKHSPTSRRAASRPFLSLSSNRPFDVLHPLVRGRRWTEGERANSSGSFLLVPMPPGADSGVRTESE